MTRSRTLRLAGALILLAALAACASGSYVGMGVGAMPPPHALASTAGHSTSG